MATPMSRECGEKSQSKIGVYVDDIRPGIKGSICTCEKEKKHQIYAIENGTEHVHIYENVTRKGILHLPSQSRCMCVSRDPSGNEHLICGIQDGRVLHWNLQHLRTETRPKKKKKKKDKNKNKEKQRASDPLLEGSKEDIFGELLNTDTRPSSPHVPLDVDQEGSFENVILLGDEDVLLTEPNVRDLMCVGGSLVTCAECTKGYTVSVYRRQAIGQSQLGCASTTHHVHDGKGIGFEKSPAFRIFLPENGMGSSSHHGVEPVGQSGVSHCVGDSTKSGAEGLLGENQTPQILCILSQSTSRNEETLVGTPERTWTLEDRLYNHLFGADLNFLDTPIILVCLPDGRIYYIPLRTRTSTQFNQTKPAGTGSMGFGPNLFFVLEQPVATIHCYNVTDADIKSTERGLPCNCLSIIGRYGRIVRITENDSSDEKEALNFTESCIQGPVQSTCRTKRPTSLLYSTGKEIHCISFQNASGRSSASETVASNVSSAFVLEILDVVALAAVGKASKDTSSSTIVALTAVGKVLKLHPSTGGVHGNRSRPITAAAAGKRMQDLLGAIKNVSARSLDLAKLSESQDRILQEMSKACHLAGSLLRDYSSGTDSSILRAEMKIRCRNDGAVCDLEILCKLTNHSLWTLSHGWSLLVCANANPDWSKLDGDTSHHSTKSVPLVDLQSIQTVEVIFPLHCGKTSLALPVDVQLYLHFSPKEFSCSVLPVKPNLNSESHFEFDDSGVSLPLTQPKTVDMLTVARPILDVSKAAQGTRPASQHQTSINRESDWLTASLQSAANARFSANGASCSISKKTKEGSSLSVIISRDICISILEDAVVHASSKVTQPEQILKWLFEDNGFLTEFVNPLRVATPDAKVVTFQVKGQCSVPLVSRNARGEISEKGEGQSKAEDKIPPRGEEAVEIAIVAPDYPTLCQLQIAVDRRLKMVLEREGKGRQISTSHERLQRELGRVQVLQRKLQTVQDATMKPLSANDQSNTHDGTATLELYLQVRNQLTLM